MIQHANNQEAAVRQSKAYNEDTSYTINLWH
jgi:hypothetical protein